MGAVPAFGDDVLDTPNATAPQAGEPAGDDAALPATPEGEAPLTLPEDLMPSAEELVAEGVAAAPYEAPGFKSIPEYNELLKQYRESHASASLKDLTYDNQFMHIVLSRRLVQKAGHENLSKKMEESPEFKAMIDWLLGDFEMLSYFTFTGEPEANDGGSKVDWKQPTQKTWMNSLEVLAKLHSKHAADVTNGGENAPLMKRLMASVALTHSARIAPWIQLDWNAERTYKLRADSEPVGRYEIFKRFYENGLLFSGFANLTVPELRMVMWAPISNNELQWANWYYHVKVWKNTDYAENPKQFGISDARHMGGMFPYAAFDYQPNSSSGWQLWDPANKEKWNNKYGFTVKDHLYDFDVTYGVPADGMFTLPLWMPLEKGGVCYMISATSTIGLAALGIPSSYAEQPAHASFLTYNKDSQNRITWGQGYDVYGMKRSGKKGVGSTSLPLGWSDLPWSSYYSMSYVFPAGEALMSQFDTDFRAAQGMFFLGEIALEENNAAEAERLFNQAIETQYMHIGAWDGLMRAYKLAGESKTAQDWIALAEKASGKIRQFASVYNDYVLNAIVPQVTEGSLDHFDLIAQLAGDLYWGKSAKNEEIQMVQPAYCREFASWWYSNLQFPMTFSFNTKAFSLSKTFADSSLDFEYSIDGGQTWKPFNRQAGDASFEMPEEDIRQITDQNDILYRAVGSKKNIRIEVTAQAAPKSDKWNNTLNDDEDIFQNVQKGIEYSTDQGAVWHPLTSDVMFEGDQEVWIRWGYSGTKLASPHTVVNFTQGEGTAERSYIKSKGGKIVLESGPDANKGYSLSNLIDGDLRTEYEMAYLKEGYIQGAYPIQTKHEQEFVFKLNDPVFLSAVEYYPAASDALLKGGIRSCEIYTSADKKAWELAGSASGWLPNNKSKAIELDKPSYAKYVKVKTKEIGTHSFNGGVFGYLTASEFKFYENYQVKSAGLERIELNSDNAKKTYKVGDRLDLSGLSVSVDFGDGGSSSVPADALEWNVDIFDRAGRQTVEGSFQGKKVSFEVEVKDNDRVASKIENVAVDASHVFYAGEEFPKSALEVKVSDGSESWYLLPDEFTVSGPLVQGKNQYTITAGSLSSTVEVTAEEGVQDLSVGKSDEFTGNYVLGDAFDPAAFTVTLTRSSGSTEPLNQSRYTVQVVTGGEGNEAVDSIDALTLTPGSKTLRFTLKDHTLFADYEVTVLPYVNEGPFTFEVSADGGECALTAYAPEPGYDSQIVNIPAYVEVGGKKVPVTGIATSAFDAAPELTGVRIPASVKDIASGAFTACVNLKHIYMTDFDSFAGFTCASDAFTVPEGETGYVFVSPNSGITVSPIPGYQIGNVVDIAKGIEIVSPARLNYELGEKLDLTGLEVYAVLDDGTKIPAVSYEVAGFDGMKSGEQTVTVSLKGTEYRDSFKVEVAFSELVVDEQPQSAAYNSIDQAKPLSMQASAPYAEPSYRWYFQESENSSAQEIKGATESTYTPDKPGYYYAEAYLNDAAGVEGSHVQSQIAFIDVNESYTATVGAKGYVSVKQAIDSTTGDVVVDMLCDSANPDSVRIAGRSVRINGHGYTLKRGTFANSMFYLNNYATKQSLHLDNVILDGSAVWTGSVDETLGRGTVNTGRKNSSPMIELQNAGSSLVISNGTVLQNNDVPGGEGGGAVYLRDSPSFTATDSSIKNCSAGGYGGAVWSKFAKTAKPEDGINISLDNVEISGCSSGQGGGALFISEFTQIQMANAHLHNNKAAGNGGAVFFEHDARTPMIVNTSFTDNAAHAGGAVATERKLVVEGSMFRDNQAVGDGGAVYSYTGSGFPYEPGVVELKSGTDAQGNTAGASGGAVFAATSATVEGASFEGNRAGSNGGAIDAAKAYVKDATFVANEAIDGGAIRAGSAFTLNTGVTLKDNIASGDGQGVYVSGGTRVSTLFWSGADQEVHLESLNPATTMIYSDLKGSALPLTTDDPIPSGKRVLQCVQQSNGFNVTLNGGKLKTGAKGGDVFLADGWMDVTQYRNGGGGGFTAPQQEGKVFAGWYTTDDVSQMNSKTALSADVKNRRVAYARFVDQDVLGLKFQTNAGVRGDADSVNLRMLSSVADLKLKEVGFEYSIDGGELRPRPTNVVFPTVSAGFSGGVDVLKPQDILSPESTRFMAFELRNIPQSAFDSKLSAAPFWVTFDGTKVMGTTRTQTVRSLVEASSSMYDAGVSHE